MYVIATVFCSNFHFSVSLHVPFSQFLFERDSYSNEYLLFSNYLQNSASIQPRTRLSKFGGDFIHLLIRLLNGAPVLRHGEVVVRRRVHVLDLRRGAARRGRERRRA